jgi:hypothetical protein
MPTNIRTQKIGALCGVISQILKPKRHAASIAVGSNNVQNCRYNIRHSFMGRNHTRSRGLFSPKSTDDSNTTHSKGH